jgi:hypothetical protein
VAVVEEFKIQGVRPLKLEFSMVNGPAPHDWRARVSGLGCPLDAPRPESNDYWDLIATLSVSSLYLAKNQTYRGQCQLIFDPRHVARRSKC